VLPQHVRCAFGPDLDGDGEQELFVLFTANANKPGEKQLNVYALSGRDGRALWFRRVPLTGTRVGPLRWWAPGPDGHPLLVIQVEESSNEWKNETYALSAGRGHVVHRLSGVSNLVVADLDGDGAPDLAWTHRPLLQTHSELPSWKPFWTHSFSSTATFKSATVRLTTLRGSPGEKARWLGSWHPAVDLDGDGIPDLIRREGDSLAALSLKNNRLLWPSKSAKAPSSVSGPTGEKAVYLPSIGLAAAPGALGDLNGDGAPDLLALGVAKRPRSKPNLWNLPLRAISGRDGGQLWNLKPLTLDTQRLPGDGFAFPNAPYYARNPNGQDFLIVSYHLEGSPSRHRLAGLTRKEGTLVWDRELALSQRQASESTVIRPLISSAEIDGVGTVLYMQAVSNEPTSGVRIRLFAIKASDGATLWEKVLDLEGPTLHLNGKDALPAPLIGRIGNGPLAVLILSFKHLLAFRADNGQQLWKCALPEDVFWADPDRFKPVWVDLKGDKRKWLCHSTFKSKLGAVLIDEKGTIHPEPWAGLMLDRTQVFAGDMDGMGKDWLILSDGGNVRAHRGGLGAPREVWRWPMPWDGEGVSTVKEMRPSNDGRHGTVVVRGSSESWIIGLDGATGKAKWRVPQSPFAEEARLVFPEGPGESLPSAVTVRPDQDTVCSLPLVARPDGGFEPLPGVTLDYPPANNDPRFLAPLPWAGIGAGLLDKEGDGGLHILWMVPAATLFFILVPFIFLRRAVRRRSLKRVAVWCLCFPLFLGIVLLFEPIERLNMDPQPWYIQLLLVGLVGLAGLPFLVFGWVVVISFFRRKWLVTGTLVGLFLLACLLVFIRTVTFGPDLEPGVHYSRDGWYHLWLPGLFLAGCLLIAGRVVATGWRLFRRLLKRRANRQIAAQQPI
jgi:outer membrane protein assembly factor BamB